MKKAVRTFNKFIRVRDGRCVQCGAVQRLNAGHVLTAQAENTRFDEKNTFGQCFKHNADHERRPDAFILWYIRKFGIEEFESLSARHWMTKEHTIEELQEIIETYKRKTEELVRERKGP